MASLYDSIRSMERSGTISKATAEAFSRTPDRTMQMPPLHKVTDDPEFVCVLLDQSGSMARLAADVIEAHPHLLDPLRASNKCQHKALLIAQYVFNAKSTPLNSFRQLSEDGRDDVVRLSLANYVPAGNTALYKTVYEMLQDTLMLVDHCKHNEGLAPRIYIMLMTDGKDTEGGVDPADIRRCLDEMRQQGSLGVACVLGLLNEKLTKEQLEAIRAILGFDLVISADATAKEVRKAMGLMSQSIAARMRG